MRRSLTTSVVAVTLVGVMQDAALAGGATTRVELHEATGDAVEPTTETEPLSAARPVPFDNLWLTIVGIVGLLLVVPAVLIESRWPRAPDQISRNGTGLGDVLTGSVGALGRVLATLRWLASME